MSIISIISRAGIPVATTKAVAHGLYNPFRLDKKEPKEVFLQTRALYLEARLHEEVEECEECAALHAKVPHAYKHDFWAKGDVQEKGRWENQYVDKLYEDNSHCPEHFGLAKKVKRLRAAINSMRYRRSMP